MAFTVKEQLIEEKTVKSLHVDVEQFRWLLLQSKVYSLGKNSLETGP